MTSITAKVRGYRGCERGDFTIAPICLIAGLNFQGKSSVAQAVAAACAGTAVPFYSERQPDKELILKKDAKELLRGGMKEGSVEISLDGKLANSAAWPALTWEGDGRLYCSKYAVGLLDAMRLDDKERQRFFSDLLKALPTIVDTVVDGQTVVSDLTRDLMEEVPNLGDTDGGVHLKRLVDMVNTSGFDAVHATVKDSGAKLKGKWEVASGEAWGIKKADGWRPKEWRKELEGKTLEAIGTECTQAEQALADARSKAAFDAGALKALIEASEHEAGAWDALQQAEAEYKTADAAAKALAVNVAGMSVPHQIACGHCGGMIDIAIKGGVIEAKQSTMGPQERALFIEQVADEKKKLAMLEEGAEELQKVLNARRAAHAAVKGSAEKVQQAKTRTGGQEAIDVAQDRVNGLAKDKAMIEAHDTCVKLFGTIVVNQKIVEILSPEGLRRKKLVVALAKFNSDLAALCGDAKYPVIALDNDLEVIYGGRKYFLLSQSEMYRVKAVLQLAIAVYDGSPLVIYDAADVLDKDGRNGLFKMAANADKLFLICMTMAEKDKVPNLSKAGMGASYWMTDGIAEEIK